jgi:hypothetical protein
MFNATFLFGDAEMALDRTKPASSAFAFAKSVNSQIPGESNVDESNTGESNANGGAPDWRQCCLRDDKGRILSNLANVMLALREDASLRDMLACDEMHAGAALRREINGKLNGAVCGDVRAKPRRVTNVDVAAIQEYLQLKGLTRVARGTVHQAIGLRARERSFHPVQDSVQDWKDPWEEPIGKYLAKKLAENETAKVLVSQIAKDALGLDAHSAASRIGTADARRIAAILELDRIGWERGRRQGKGRFWIKKKPNPTPTNPAT